MRQIGTITKINIGKLKKTASAIQEDKELRKKLEQEIARPFAKDMVDHDWRRSQEESWIRSGMMNLYEGFSTEENIANVQKQADYCRKYGQTLALYLVQDGYAVVMFPSGPRILPESCLAYNLFPDYSDTPVALLRGGNTVELPPSAFGGEMTENRKKREIEDKQEEIRDAENRLKQENDKMNAEIAEMKRQIEKQYESKLAEMREKMDLLNQQKQQLQKEMFLLDTEIYAIRCFYGETVTFTKVASGKDCPVEEPLVIYQKVRYLDEELAKAVSIYGIDGNDTGIFEDLVAAREDIRDLFFPAGKSVSLVRVSADGKIHVPEQKVDVYANSFNIYNVISEYAVFHGTKTAILVRNGDNCYIGWTETDRVNVQEDVFLTPKAGELKSCEEADKPKNETPEDVVSRYFVFSILQGLVANSKMIQIPEGNVFTPDAKNIILSMADGWITDTRFGTLSDILEKTNVNIQKGDDLLVTQDLVDGEARKYKAWFSGRGTGDRNLTHDVRAEDNTVYKANKVVLKSRKVVRCEVKYLSDKEWEKAYIDNHYRDYTLEDYEREYSKNPDYRNPVEEEVTKTDVYISLRKTEDVWRGYDYHEAKGRANFKLYPDEYINLTFLNTVYIKSVLMNRNLGYKTSRNFSSFVPYLNHILEYLREREETESALIRQYMPDLPEEWQVALSEWKIENNVHNITDYQARRFAKWVAGNSKN